MRQKQSEMGVAEIQVSYTPTHDPQVQILSTQDALRVIRKAWTKDKLTIHSKLGIILMNDNNQVLGFRDLFTGGLQHSGFDKRIIFAIICKALAAKIIVVQSHPSGAIKPSPFDRYGHEELADACNLMDIDFHDHIFVSHTGKYFSFSEHGIL